MAATPQGALLTAQHRAQQIQLRVVTVRDLLKVWRIFDPKAISESWDTLEPALVALIQSRRVTSAALTAEYLRAFGLAEIGAAPASVQASVLPADEIIPNLRLLGPANAWDLTRKGRTAAEVARTTLTMVAGEVTRQTLNGGRRTLTDTVSRDRRIRGYTRVTDGSPCAFCAMVAGRGPVYRSEQTASFEAHLKCGCTGEPVYASDAPWSPSAQRYRDMYDQASRAVPSSVPKSDRGAAVRREFRRLYEASNG